MLHLPENDHFSVTFFLFSYIRHSFTSGPPMLRAASEGIIYGILPLSWILYNLVLKIQVKSSDILGHFLTPLATICRVELNIMFR